MRHIAALLLAASLAAIAPDAFAATLDPGWILKNFNAVIYQNATTTADIEGAAVVGGNFNGATVYNAPTTRAPTGYAALTVLGATNGNWINLDNGGSAYVGGQHGAGINFNGGGSYTSSTKVSISDFKNALDSLSASLAKLGKTGDMPKTDNNEVIKATAGSNGVAVFNLAATALDAIPSYKIDLNGAKTVIFNVSGTSVDFRGNLEDTDALLKSGATKIIWNFYQATSVTFETQIVGTVLAVNATVTNQNQIDGTLVANKFNGHGELHSYGFDGYIPPPPGTDISRVPEPAPLALMGAVLLALALLGRRRPRRLSLG